MNLTYCSAGARLDRLPISAFHYRTLGIIGAGMFLDVFELTLASGVLGTLVRDGWSDLGQNALFISMTFVGMVIGAWSAGILGDRFGRRFCYRINLLLFAIPSFAAAFAPSMSWLIIARFFMGIGMGAEIVVGFATLSEFVPPLQRGRWGAALSAIMNSAAFVSALVGYLIIPRFGWRWVFATVGVCALGVWALRKALPESPRWLEAKGQMDAAEKTIAAIEREVEQSNGPLAPLTFSPGTPVSPMPLRALFSVGLWRRTLVGATLLVALNVISFAFIAWLPTFLIKQGFSVQGALGFNAVASLGGPAGALIGLWFSDRVGRRPSIIGFLIGTLALVVAYPYATNLVASVFLAFLIITFVYVLSCLAIAIYVPELFPTELRMRGAGFCNTAGRSTVIAVQFAVVPLFQATGVSGVMAMQCVFLVVAIVVMWAFGQETNRLSLEQLASQVSGERSNSATVINIGKPVI